MTAILGRTGNLVSFTTGRGTTPWDTEMEAALRKMDAMLASTVVAITNTLPGSANEGDLYLVGTAPTGVAAGWANRIARWRSSPAGWEAYRPMQGWIVTIVGETTNKVRRYNGTAWVALAADAGAEPYAGVPAQTSFWRSTAAGVRAWVQLVAADITDLATVLAGYLTKADPTYTGTLTGPRATLTEFGTMAAMPGDSNYATLHATGVTRTGTNYALRLADDGTNTLVNASSNVALAIAGTAKLGVTTSAVNLGSGVALQINATTVIDSSRNATFEQATLNKFGTLRDRVDNPTFGALYAAGVTPATVNYALAMTDAGTETYLGASDKVALVVGGASKLTVTASEVNLASGVALKMSANTVIDSSRNITGATLKGGNLTGTGNRPLVAGADGTIDDQDAAAFRGTIGALAASLKGAANGVAELGADGRVPTSQLPSSALLALGETSATAYRGDRGKIAYDHSQIVTGNPHGTTAEDVGALAKITLSGSVDFNSFNGGVPCVAVGDGASYANAPYLATQLVGYGGTLIQGVGASGSITQIWCDVRTGTIYYRGKVGTVWGAWASIHDSYNMPSGATGKAVFAAANAATARAAISAAKAPSKVDVSASTTLGAIDASSIKVTTTDVILTLSGGVDGQGWDIINPTRTTGIAIPSGATLWKSIGFDVGPTTVALGGGRPIRITRIDTNTWTMLGSQ